MISEIDKKYLEDLKKISKDIYAISLSLAELDSKGKKRTKEFASLLKKYSAYAAQEKKLYDLIGKDTKKVTNILYDILNYEDYTLENALECIKKDEGVENLRIARYFYRLLDEDETVYEETLEEDDDDFDEIDDSEEDIDNDMEDIKDYLQYCLTLSNEVEKDIVNTILKILNEFIKNSNNNLIKEELFKVKYQLFYLFDYVAKDFLYYDFKDSIPTFWTSPCLSLKYGDKSKEDLQNIYKDYSENILFNQVEDLLDAFFINDSEFTKEDAKEFAIAEIFTRAALLFASPVVKDNFQDYLTVALKEIENYDSSYYEEGLKNGAKEIITSIINKTKVDQENIETIMIRIKK